MLLSLSLYLLVISSLLRIYSWSLCSSNASKERRGHLVKWMEKASFARLNKLFKIDVVEWAHNVLLSRKNLLALIENPKSFIIPVFPQLAPPSLVPSEHFMLKDLPFYEVSCLVDSEACQARLKKGQKETLRQAPATGRLSSSSVVHPPTRRNKKYVTRPVQRARTPSLTSPSSSSSSSSSSSLSSSSSNNKPEARVGRLVPPIICEEEEMTSNLRVGFCERKRKCLSKSIIVNPSSLKKTCPKPTIDPLSKSILSTIVVAVTSNPNKKPFSIDDISYHEARKPFIVLENISEESFKCLHSSPPIQRQPMSPASRRYLSF